MDLNAIAVFVKVVEAGSFLGAARTSEIPKSTIARRIDELEASLGVRLLQRSTRQLSLTEVGRAYYERCRRIVEDIDDASASVSSHQREPQGKLRFTTTSQLADAYIGQWAVEYLQRYPRVELDMFLTGRRVDLLGDGFDLAFRVGRLERSTHIVRQLGPIPRYVCASPAYLEAHGVPRTPQDLRDHQCVVHSPERAKQPWALDNDQGDSVSVAVTGRLVVNSFEVALHACLAGFGIAYLPSFICCESIVEGRLVHLLSEWQSSASTLHALYPSRLHLSPMVRTFLDFMTEKLTPTPWLVRG